MFQCQFSGNLTSDPEVKTIGSGYQVVNFCVAVNKRWKDKNGEAKEEVNFIQCEAWEKTADLIGKYFRKGDYMLISAADIKTDTWEDKDGNKRSKQKFRVNQIEFVPGLAKKAADEQGEGQPAEPAKASRKPARATKPKAESYDDPNGGFVDPNENEIPF